MNKKGYSYTVLVKQIRSYRQWSLSQKFAWLEAANRFSFRVIKKENRVYREALRKGTI